MTTNTIEIERKSYNFFDDDEGNDNEGNFPRSTISEYAERTKFKMESETKIGTKKYQFFNNFENITKYEKMLFEKNSRLYCIKFREEANKKYYFCIPASIILTSTTETVRKNNRIKYLFNMFNAPKLLNYIKNITIFNKILSNQKTMKYRKYKENLHNSRQGVLLSQGDQDELRSLNFDKFNWCEGSIIKPRLGDSIKFKLNEESEYIEENLEDATICYINKELFEKEINPFLKEFLRKANEGYMILYYNLQTKNDQFIAYKITSFNIETKDKDKEVINIEYYTSKEFKFNATDIYCNFLILEEALDCETKIYRQSDKYGIVRSTFSKDKENCYCVPHEDDIRLLERGQVFKRDVWGELEIIYFKQYIDVDDTQKTYTDVLILKSEDEGKNIYYIYFPQNKNQPITNTLVDRVIPDLEIFLREDTSQEMFHKGSTVIIYGHSTGSILAALFSLNIYIMQKENIYVILTDVIPCFTEEETTRFINLYTKKYIAFSMSNYSIVININITPTKNATQKAKEIKGNATFTYEHVNKIRKTQTSLDSFTYDYQNKTKEKKINISKLNILEVCSYNINLHAYINKKETWILPGTDEIKMLSKIYNNALKEIIEFTSESYHSINMTLEDVITLIRENNTKVYKKGDKIRNYVMKNVYSINKFKMTLYIR